MNSYLRYRLQTHKHKPGPSLANLQKLETECSGLDLTASEQEAHTDSKVTDLKH